MLDLLIPPAHAAEKEQDLLTAMTSDPKWFIFYGLAVFFLIVWRAGGFAAITNMLDARAKKIETDLAEAANLRAQAAKLLADYEAKRLAAEAEAAAIVSQARQDADALRAQAAKDLDAELARREAMTAERIQRAEATAFAEVRGVAADAAIEAAEALLRQRLGAGDQSRLIAQGAKELAVRFAG
jgi:F-type H+-transporting ATPase subunit b